MEAILKSFHLNPAHVSSVLQLTGGIIAGSAPLSVVKPTFVPNDLDIWVETKNTVDEWKFLDTLYNKVLTQAGYVYDNGAFNYKMNEDACLLYRNISNIQKIKQYEHPSGKKIQVLYIRCSPIENLKQFDFNICRIYYDGSKLHSDYMNDIVNGVFYYIRDGSIHNNVKSLLRKEKYIARGFKYKESVTE